MQNHIPMMVKRSKSKQVVEFKYGGRLLSGTGISIVSQPWMEISGRNLVRKYFFVSVKARRHKTKSKSRFATAWPPHGCHLGKSSLHNVITLSVIQWSSNSDKICYVGAESHTDDDIKFKSETGSRIHVWRPFGFFNAEVVVSQL